MAAQEVQQKEELDPPICIEHRGEAGIQAEKAIHALGKRPRSSDFF
jgi:hypothetical protein